MALIYKLWFIFLLSLFSCTSASLVALPKLPSSINNICNLTPYPKFCQFFFPQGNGIGLHGSGLFFIQKSLSSSKQLLSIISNFLQNGSSISKSTSQALEDCKLLGELNEDYLSHIHNTISLDNILGSQQAEDLLTLLSATLTNLQTCLDGLEQVTPNPTLSVFNKLLLLLSKATKLHGISLALFKQGWRTNMLINSSDWQNLIHIDGVAEVCGIVVVNPDGSGDFTTINDAVAAAPNNTDGNNGFYVIRVVAGVYEEYVTIPKYKQYLMMIGDGINQTVITGNRSVAGGWTTFNSTTFAAIGKGFVAINITFRNTAGASNYQAVALRSDSDLSAFYYCSFEGYQDTLYTHAQRQFYRNCDIYGTVDFIFGNAAVVFQDCNIYARLPLEGQYNTITAQGRTDINQNTGISIQNCTITAANDLAASNGTTQTYLGRPWKEYSQTVYMQSFLDSLINPAGWAEWSGDFALSTLYYAEYDNYGPGSNTSNRVTWPGYHIINASVAVNFTVSNFIQGDSWLPATGVPYYSGLL